MATTKTAVFTEEETRLIRGAVMQVWDEVAYDLLTGIAEEKGKDVGVVTVSRALAIEVSLDAGRPEEVIRDRMRKETPEAKADLLARWASLDYKAKIKFVTPHFTYARWGL